MAGGSAVNVALTVTFDVGMVNLLPVTVTALPSASVTVYEPKV